MRTSFTNKIYVALAALILSFCFNIQSFGQFASQYGFTAIAGTYTTINGTAFTAVQADDQCPAATIPLGFTFNFCGVNYTTIRACSNGYMTFTTGAGQTLTNATTSFATVKPALMWLWDDMDGANGQAVYATTGTAPNRVFTFQYKNWDWNWSAVGPNISCQVKLYETTNVVEYVYNQEAQAGNPSGSGGASIGIVDGQATPSYLSLNNATATPAASSTTFTDNVATKPATGQIYRFTPPVPCNLATGIPVSAATTITPEHVCVSQNVTLGYTPITPLPPMSGITYKWQSAPAATGPWSDLGTTGFNAPTFTTTTLVSTPLFFRCQILCNASSVLLTSTPSQVIIDNPGIPEVESHIVHCGLGNVELLVNPGVGNTVRWYRFPTQTTPISTANPYTTPYLTLDSNATFMMYASSITAAGCEGVKKAIDLDVFPEPSIDLGPDGNKCVEQGDGIVLDAGFQDYVPQYLWDDNSTSQVRSVTESGTYSVMVTNQYNCIGRDTIHFTIINNPVINLNDTVVCNGVDVTLDAGDDGSIYFWNTGETSQVITVNVGGSYNVFVANDGGCISTDTFQLTMQGELPSIQGIQITNNGDMKFQFSAAYPQNVVGYKWDFGDGSPFNYSQSPIHEYQNISDYIVVLKLSSVCGYVMDTTSAHIVGINQINLSNEELNVYPNPAKNGQATIVNKGSLKMEKVEVYSILGQRVYSSKSDSDVKHVIDLGNMAAGLYTIEVYTDKGTVARKLEIIK